MKTSIAVGAALAIPHSRVLGANDDIRVGVVGFRGQGGGHINRFLTIPGVRLVALCDVDRKVLDGQLQKAAERNEKVDGYTDVRRMLDDNNIDAISTATPNHWHALITIWACQAGKDVYVEKPVSHNVSEGRKMVEAARKYNRIVQTGTQKRSDEGLRQAFEYIQQGNLGRIVVARGFCYKRRRSIGKVPGPQPVPESVDYNLWTGPAPLEPLMRTRLHYDWHWVWPTGCGDMGNQGIHEMDLCRWAIGQNQLPPRVMSIGGRFGYDDDGDTANTQMAVLDYKPAPIIFETRGLPRKKDDLLKPDYKGIRVGIVIQCENGYFAGGGGGGWIYDNDGNKIKQFKGDGGGGHQSNFIKAVRSRKRSDLNADILEGHLSSALCHLGNISHRLGSKTSAGEIRRAVQDRPMIAEAYQRFSQHLADNEVDTAVTPATLGPWLELDTSKEKFIGAGEYGLTRWANELATRNYRRPFVVPENV